MIREKYAIRFPGMQDLGKSISTSIFSEEAIIATGDAFEGTFDAFGSLMELAAQKKRTCELSKRLDVRKAAIDEIVENQKEQEKIKYETDVERLQIRLETEKEKMKLDMEEMLLKAREKISKFAVSFEETMRSNQILLGILRSEQKFLNDVQPYIESLAGNYSQRREYVLYCERQRRSLELIGIYLGKMT